MVADSFAGGGLGAAANSLRAVGPQLLGVQRLAGAAGDYYIKVWLQNEPTAFNFIYITV